MLRRVLAAVVFLAILLRAETAHATTTARLVYLRGSGSETCPDESALRDAVAARLGYDPFTPYSFDTLFAEVEKEGGAFVARVKLVAHDNTVRGARTLKTRSACADLMTTLALTISLAIDPLNGMREGPPEGLPPSERHVEIIEEPPRVPPPPHDVTPGGPPKEEKVPERVRVAVGAGLAGTVGVAPGPAVGLRAFGRARLGDFSVALEGLYDFPAGASADAGIPGRVSSSLVAGSLLPCGHTGDFFACARGSLGRLSAEGLDLSHPGASGVLWAAVGGRLGWELPFGPTFALHVHGDADFVITRYALQIGGRTAFRYPPFDGGLGVALVVVLR